MGFGIRMAEKLAEEGGVDEDRNATAADGLTLDDVRDDDVGKYAVNVHCGDCGEIILRGQPMTGKDMAAKWILIVASAPLSTPKCPKGCRSTYSDCNANSKLRIGKVS